MIVIDSNDEEGLKYVKTDVDILLQERDLKDIPCIVVFNKSKIRKINGLSSLDSISGNELNVEFAYAHFTP
jgi:50S ribosomal subunit-associated GTPase HflX